MIEQVDCDIKHTHPDVNFFHVDSSFAKSNEVNLQYISVEGIQLGYMTDHLFGPGFSEKYINYLCQAECWDKVICVYHFHIFLRRLC